MILRRNQLTKPIIITTCTQCEPTNQIPRELSGQFALYTRTIRTTSTIPKIHPPYSNLRLSRLTSLLRRIILVFSKIRMFPIRLSVFRLAYDYPRLVKTPYLT